MKTCLRVVAVVLVSLFLNNTFAQCVLPTINLQNPSFEGVPQMHVTPAPWSICMPGQTPDTQPGSWGVTMPPTNGSTYLGLVHQPSTGWQEGASEPLNTPLVAGTTYTFSIDLANSSNNQGPPIGIIPGCVELQIWGGYGACDRNTLLWNSGNVTPFDTWITYTVSFTAPANFTWIFFQVNSLGCTDGPYLLVDNIGTITPTPLQLQPTVLAAACNGTATGSAYMSYSGGTQPLTFTWSNGVTTQNNSNLFAGTYTLTVVDGANCTATASITVTEPTAITVTTSSTDASCTVNNGTATVSASGGTGAFTYLWSNSLTTQTISNLAPGTYSVTVRDGNSCTATPPGSVTINAIGSIALSPVAYDAACGNSNGSAIANPVAGTAPFTFAWSNGGTTDTISGLPPGTYDVTVTGADGCTASASLTVGSSQNLGIATVQNNINCGGNTGSVRVTVTAGTPPYTYAWSNGGTTDEITNLPSGTYSVTVTGFGGCSASASETVSTDDITAPEALCQDITITLTGNSASITAADVDGGSSDDCGSITLDVIPSLFDCSSLGGNAVTLTATDGGGNSASCGATVTVIDNTAPVASCHNLTLALNGSSASITAADIDAGSSDECSLTLSISPSTFDCSNLGANSVTLTAADGSSNSSSCGATVTIIDDTPPAAVCQDVTLALTGTSVSITANDVDAGSTDNCSIVSRDVTPSEFTCANSGSNNVTLTIIDGSGNTASCSAIVTVTETGTPVVACQDIRVSLVGNSVSINADDVDAGSSDNCGLSLSVVPSSFDCSQLGANTVTLTGTDGSGNSSSCTATVTVADDTDPVAACKDITVGLSTTSVSISAIDIDNGSSDNCSVSLSAAPIAFDCSNLGANTVTLTATDPSGRSSSCNATVTVNDIAAPVVSCNTVVVTLSGGTATITVDDVNGGASDNCSYTLAVEPSFFQCSDLGDNDAILTATDQSGNSSSCIAVVRVLGGSPFTCSVTSTPEPSSQITNAPPTVIYLGYGPQRTKLAVSTSVPGNYTYSWSPAAGLDCTDCAAPIFSPVTNGVFVFTATVTDQHGCQSTCSISICVVDVRASGGCGRGNGGGTGGTAGSPNHGNSPGFVYVCHVPPGNPANAHVICIGVAGVPAHVPLHGGDRLGRCEINCSFAKTDETDNVPQLIYDETGEGFDILVYPNPFSSQFHITVETFSEERIDIRMFDVLGQIVAVQNGVEPNKDIVLGDGLSNGFYFIEVTQGGIKRVIRMTKGR